MLSVPESISFTWRLSVKTAPEKPKFIIAGIQTATDGDQTKNPSTFDHVNLKNAYVMLNSDRYPAVDCNLSFSNQKFSRVYGDAALFVVKFFGMDELITQSNITPSGDYKTLYPLFTFDVSKQKEKIKSSVVDMQIKSNLIEIFLPTQEHLHWLFQTRCCHSSLTVTKCLCFIRNLDTYSYTYMNTYQDLIRFV